MDDMNPVQMWLLGLLSLLVTLVVIVGSCAAIPQYNVYQQEKSGEAEFKRAEQNRRIQVEEAQAELDAASLLAEADIIRAAGIAEANAIIGATLTKEYIEWRFVEGLHDGSSEIIYVPTEANLPILEASRLSPLEPSSE